MHEIVFSSSFVHIISCTVGTNENNSIKKIKTFQGQVRIRRVCFTRTRIHPHLLQVTHTRMEWESGTHTRPHTVAAAAFKDRYFGACENKQLKEPKRNGKRLKWLCVRSMLDDTPEASDRDTEREREPQIYSSKSSSQMNEKQQLIRDD